MSVVRIEREGAVLRLTLDRPDKLNALNGQVLRELTDAVTALEDDQSVRVVALRGAGRAFSAGADLSGSGSPAASSASTWASRRHASGGWQRLLDKLEALTQVTVAGVHGHCIGGAALLAIACDIRIADATLQVRIPELAIGIPLTWGGNPRLVREIGLPLTRDLVMTGRMMDAHEALARGFVQRIVPSLDDGVQTCVDELLEMPDAPLRMTKAMTSAIGRAQMGATAWSDADLIGWSLTEDESREAATKYASKRARRKP